jgi:hypothetical protein
MVRSRSRHLKASNKPGRAALVCRIVSFGALAIFIAAHLEGDPHRAFTALAADPRITCERQEATQGCCWSKGDAAADQRQAYQGGQEEGREGPRLLALGSGHEHVSLDRRKIEYWLRSESAIDGGRRVFEYEIADHYEIP